MSEQRKYKRRKKLIKPRFQLKVALSGLGIAFMSVLLLMIMINEAFMEFADRGWVDAVALRSEWMDIMFSRLLVALAFLVPMILALGVVLTHRIAGPLYRFEMFLTSVMAGEHPEPCRLRNGDELMEFCDLLNEVTEPLRNGSVPLPYKKDEAPEELSADEPSDEDVAEDTGDSAEVEAKVA